MSHYDGGEFEKMLQEAEANMLRGIPSMEVIGEGGMGVVPASAREARVEKPKASAPPTQGRSDPPLTSHLHFGRLLFCT